MSPERRAGDFPAAMQEQADRVIAEWLDAAK